ncbi:MAG: hypothetical protein NTY42_05520 [Planctomycetota bacterium]|nr:hypothetical protein [Planctomycetota bacterium]
MPSSHNGGGSVCLFNAKVLPFFDTLQSPRKPLVRTLAMNQPWWIVLLKPILFSVLFYFVARVINRRLSRRWKDDESRSLRHQSWVPILGAVTVILFLGLAIISNTVGKNATTNIWTTSFFVGFGILGFPLIADYLFSRHRVTEEGIDYGGIFGMQGFMPWKSFNACRFRQRWAGACWSLQLGPRLVFPFCWRD